MINQLYKDIYDEQLAEGAIINDRMKGFREDYLTLHCLLKKYEIKSCFEVGCHFGFGTKIIKKCLGESGIVFSLDLPDELAILSKQHPVNDGQRKVGHECDLPFILLRGNSMTFNYSNFPCEGYYLDGEHTSRNVEHEVTEILKINPKLVVLHDTDLPEVMEGLVKAFDNSENKNDYDFYRVSDTRISYLKNKNI